MEETPETPERRLRTVLLNKLYLPNDLCTLVERFSFLKIEYLISLEEQEQCKVTSCTPVAPGRLTTSYPNRCKAVIFEPTNGTSLVLWRCHLAVELKLQLSTFLVDKDAKLELLARQNAFIDAVTEITHLCLASATLQEPQDPNDLSAVPHFFRESKLLSVGNERALRLDPKRSNCTVRELARSNWVAVLPTGHLKFVSVKHRIVWQRHTVLGYATVANSTELYVLVFLPESNFVARQSSWLDIVLAHVLAADSARTHRRLLRIDLDQTLRAQDPCLYPS